MRQRKRITGSMHCLELELVPEFAELLMIFEMDQQSIAAVSTILVVCR